MARTAVLLMAALTLASVGGVMAARTQGATTNDGVYTAAQAAEGKALYGQVCESCHQPAKFSGAEFARAYGGRSLVGGSGVTNGFWNDCENAAYGNSCLFCS